MIGSLKNVASLLVSTFILMVGFGVAGYITPLRSMDEGWSTFDVSMVATAYSLGFATAALIIPILVRRVGHIRVFATLIGVLLLTILGAAMIVELYAWMIFRLFTGFAMAGIYMTIETWLNERASNEYRGALYSFYMITTTVGSICGNFIVPFGNRGDSSLFIIAAMLYALAILPITLSTAPAPSMLTAVVIDLPKLWRRTPVAFVGAILTGVINGAWLAMVAVYTNRMGLDAAAGAGVQAAAIFGSMVLQVPIGRLSDLIDRRIVMVGAGVIGVISCISVALIPYENWLGYHLAVFFMGGVLFPIYSLNNAHANDLALPGEYVAVSSGVMMLYGMGVVLGPLTGGTVMAVYGPQSLLYMLAVMFLAYGIYALWRILRRPETLEPEDKGDFQPLSGPLQGAVPQGQPTEDPA